MEQADFVIEDFDGATPEQIKENTVQGCDVTYKPQLIEIVRSYLQVQNPVSLAQTAESIITLLPEPGDKEAPDPKLGVLWEVLFHVAEQIPYNHAFQAKLARLVISLRYSHKTSLSSSYDGDGKHSYKIELRLFGEEMADLEGDPFEMEDIPEEESKRRWINIYAFYANVHSAGYDMSSWCRNIMSLAFSTPTNEHEQLNCHVPAAAQWINYAGQLILQDALLPREVERRYGGVKVNAAESLQQWRQWKAGFKNIAAEQNLNNETRELSLHAAELMEALERALVKDG